MTPNSEAFIYLQPTKSRNCHLRLFPPFFRFISFMAHHCLRGWAGSRLPTPIPTSRCSTTHDTDADVDFHLLQSPAYSSSLNRIRTHRVFRPPQSWYLNAANVQPRITCNPARRPRHRQQVDRPWMCLVLRYMWGIQQEELVLGSRGLQGGAASST